MPKQEHDPRKHIPFTDEERAYFEQLGLFVTIFAQIERGLFLFSAAVNHIPFEIHQALFSGSARVHEMLGRIRKVLAASEGFKVNGPPVKTIREAIEPALIQMGVINSVRNDLLHYGVDMTGPSNPWTVSNRHLKSAKPNEFLISVRDLECMTEDLDAIGLVIGYWAGLIEGYQFPPEFVRFYDETARKPWRYKRP